MNERNAMKLLPAASILLVGLAAVFAMTRGDRGALAQTAPAAVEAPVAVDAPAAIGKQATIHVRRDFLAGEPLLPIGPTEDRVRGAEISVRGVLRSIDDHWIVLERDRTIAYVPRKSVLVMEIAK